MAAAENAYKQWLVDWCLHHQEALQQVQTGQLSIAAFWPQLTEDKLHALHLPSQWGGLAKSPQDFFSFLECLSMHCPSLALSVLASSQLCADAIVHFGSDAQKDWLLPKICSGTWIGALGLSEDESGSDAMAMQCTLSQTTANEYQLHGHKMWITNAPIADVALIYARDDHENIRGVLTPLNLAERSEPIDKFGMKASPTGRLRFDQQRITAKQILPNDGKRILQTTLTQERLLLSAIPLGIMASALEKMRKHATSRRVFGQLLAEKQCVQVKLANAFTAFHACEALIDKAFRCQPGKTQSALAASAYLHTSENATRVANDCMDLYGAWGYTDQTGIASLLADAKLFQTGGGTECIRQLIIGRFLTTCQAF